MIAIRRARREDIPGILAVFAHDEHGGHREATDPAPLHVYETAFGRIESDPNTALYVSLEDEDIVGTFQLQYQSGLIDQGLPDRALSGATAARCRRGG